MFPDPLRAFQLVVRTGSIRKASEQLGVAPSSVSRQVAILERMIGTSLFSREGGGLALTHAGQLVAEYSNMVLAGFDSLRLDLNDMRGSSRHLTVAMVESITSVGPVKTLAAFTEAYPNTTFSFTVLPAPDVVEAVRTQKCDIGIGFNAVLDQSIQSFAQFEEPIVAVLPIGHPLANKQSLRLHDLVNEPLGLPNRDFGVRRLFERICVYHDLQISPVMQTNAFEALRDFARTGTGIAILPLRAALYEDHVGKAKVVSLSHRFFLEGQLDVLLLKQQRLPRMTRLFCEALRDHLSLPEEFRNFLGRSRDEY